MHIIAVEETCRATRSGAHMLGECLVLVLFIAGCQKPESAPPVATPEDSPVTPLGSLEVTARLVEIPEGAIFKRDLYNYATVLKYQVLEVHRGQVTEPAIYVAQYNPFKPRAKPRTSASPASAATCGRFAADKCSGWLWRHLSTITTWGGS
jgi:hypothetical protein